MNVNRKLAPFHELWIEKRKKRGEKREKKRKEERGKYNLQYECKTIIVHSFCIYAAALNYLPFVNKLNIP